MKEYGKQSTAVSRARLPYFCFSDALRASRFMFYFSPFCKSKIEAVTLTATQKTSGSGAIRSSRKNSVVLGSLFDFFFSCSTVPFVRPAIKRTTLGEKIESETLYHEG